MIQVLGLIHDGRAADASLSVGARGISRVINAITTVPCNARHIGRCVEVKQQVYERDARVMIEWAKAHQACAREPVVGVHDDERGRFALTH